MKNFHFKPRDYQQEVIDTIARKGNGKWLVHMATGLGKTVTFANVPRQGRTLILSHRDELVRQPLKYFDCSTGIEKGKERSNGEQVISASVQSMARRLDNFDEGFFDTIITDECHHAAAKTYRKIYEHFKPCVHLGFTATPSRGDDVGLDRVYDEIIYSKDLRWGIENGWLSPIECLRVDVGYNLSDVAVRMGDLAIGDLEKAVNIEGANHAIAEAYQKYAVGQTLIFAVNVVHAQAIAAVIPDAVAVSAQSKDRANIVKQFLNGDIKCLVNCALFTEGTDFPNVETVIIARPTKSATLYTQMAGRGTRLAPGKEKCLLIDCVGAVGRHNICTAPTLIGLDISQIERTQSVQGDLLMDIPDIVQRESDTPRSWIRNAEIVSLWSRQMHFKMHNVDWFRLPDGSFVLSLGNKQSFHINTPDQLQDSTLDTGTEVFIGNMQYLFDTAYKILNTCFDIVRPLWDKRIKSRWGIYPATEKQKALIARRRIDVDLNNLSKMDACKIITRLCNG